MYSLFQYFLRAGFTEPPGNHNLAKNRLVDMYSKCTEADVKESIVKSFCDPSGILRVVIATIAFGMGLDCPNVRQIILWGPPSDVEAVVESRDGHLNFDLPRALISLGVISCIVHSSRLSIVPLFLCHCAVVFVWIDIFLV